MKLSWEAIKWWELRRLVYNAILFGVGIFSIVIVEVVGSRMVKLGQDVIEPMLLIPGVFVYGLAANAFYTLGWISEHLWTGGDTSITQKHRSKVFWIGTIFSAVLTLVPAFIVTLIWAVSGFK